MINQRELTKKYFEEFIEYEKYIEIRVLDRQATDKRFAMKSYIVSNWEETETLIEQYLGNDRYIIYNGCNCREIKGKKREDIKFRRIFFFDFENDGIKPPLTDKVYKMQLLECADVITKHLKAKYGLQAGCLSTSGRGMHVSYKIQPFIAKEWNKKFIQWYKDVMKELQEILPHQNIKFDSMFDLARIESTKGTQHMKYPEKPWRQILFLDTFQNDMVPLIKDIHIVKPKMNNVKVSKADKYTNDTILSCPEAILLSTFHNLPEGQIHTHLIFSLKMRAWRNNIDLDIIQEFLTDLGYGEVVENPPDDLEMNTKLWLIYMLNYYEFFYDNREVLKSVGLLKRDFITNNKNYKQRKDRKFELEQKDLEKLAFPIESYLDMKKYIVAFNKTEGYLDDFTNESMIFVDELKEQLLLNTKNSKLYHYLDIQGELDRMLGFGCDFGRR